MLHFFLYSNCWLKFTDLEGKTDLKIRALEILEELRGNRADKQVRIASLELKYMLIKSLCCSFMWLTY